MTAARRQNLIAIGLIAGVAQVGAGVAMYLAGVYFAPWSAFVSLAVLLLCIVTGTRRHAARCLNGEITYRQALGVGIIISVSTGLIYALYNVVSISLFYPHFLDDLVRAQLADVAGHDGASFATMRSHVTALGVAIPNCIRLSVFGSFLSTLTSWALRTSKPATG